MAKMRIHQLAKQLGVDARTLINALNEMGEPVKSASATLVQPVVRKLIEHPDVRARRSQTLEIPPEGARPESSSRIDEVPRAQSTASTYSEQPSPPELEYASKSTGGRKDPSLAEVRRRVTKAASRVAGAAARTAQLEELIRLGTHSPLSRMDASATRNQLVREMQKVRSLRPKVSAEEDDEGLRVQLIEVRRGARELEERLNQLTFDNLPALRPALVKAAHERSGQDIEVSPSPAKTSRRMEPKRPKPEMLTPKRRQQVENAATRADLSTSAMCDALSHYVGFDVVLEVEMALDYGETIRQTTDWLRSEGAPDNLSRDDVVRIAKEARRLRRRHRSLERARALRARKLRASQEAAVRDVVRDATRSRGTAWIDGSRSTNVHQVSGGLPTLGRRR